MTIRDDWALHGAGAFACSVATAIALLFACGGHRGPEGGAIVVHCEPGYAAASGGIETGDTIVHWRRGGLGGPIDCPFDLAFVEQMETPAGPVELTLRRGRHEFRTVVQTGGWGVQAVFEDTEGGVYVAATCNDCHSTGGSAHRILSPGSPGSSINHSSIPKTRGKSHKGGEADFWEGIHGHLVARSETDAPVCTDCHGEHGILSPDDPRSPVSRSHVAGMTPGTFVVGCRQRWNYGDGDSVFRRIDPDAVPRVGTNRVECVGCQLRVLGPRRLVGTG